MYELLDELRTVAEQRRTTKNRTTRIVAAAKTSVTDIYGVGSMIATFATREPTSQPSRMGRPVQDPLPRQHRAGLR